MDKFKILPLDNQKKSGQSNSVIPQHQFSLLLLAPRGSGKTTTLLNLMMNPNFYKGFFNNIYIWSPTLRQDEKWRTLLDTSGILAKNKVVEELMERNDKTYAQAVEGKSSKEAYTGHIAEANCYTQYDEKVLADIMSFQELQIQYLQAHGKSKKDSDKVLLIFDDALGLDNTLFKRNRLFQKLNTINRHLNISIVLVSQAYKMIPRTVRTNMNAYVVYEIANQRELQVFYEENNNGLSWNEWLSKYKEAIGEPYSFMYMNYQLPKPRRLMKRFEEIL